MTEQATQSGAPTPQPAAQPAASPAERLKAHWTQSEKPAEPAKQAEPQEQVESNAPEGAVEEEVVQEADGQEHEVKAKPTTLTELAETLGADIEDVLGIDVPTKIDGKEGKARLRDLIKSYQLEQHLNQKSMAFADERKAFEAEAQRKSAESQQRIQQLDAALQVGQRLLDGEFANVNWDELQASDRLEFNQKVVEYQQRQQALQHLAGIIGKEREQQQQQAAAEFAAYKAEQMKLLEFKLPEWSDKAKREADIKGMSEFLKDAYGIPQERLMSEVDHAMILMARDAWKWHTLQKQKPATLNKVKAAPQLLRPGATQSRAAQDGLALKNARDRARSTGKTSDIAQVLKQLGVARV